MIGRVTLGDEAMLFDWRSRGGSQPHFHLDDATLPRNVAANAAIRFFQSHVVSEATPEERRQDFSKHLGTAKQSKSGKCRIMRDRGSCTRLVRFSRTNGPFLQSCVLCCLSAHKETSAAGHICTARFSVPSPEALSIQCTLCPCANFEDAEPFFQHRRYLLLPSRNAVVKGAVLGEFQANRSSVKRKAGQYRRASGPDVSVQEDVSNEVERADGTHAAHRQALHGHDEPCDVAGWVAGVKSIPIDCHYSVPNKEHMVRAVAPVPSGECCCSKTGGCGLQPFEEEFRLAMERAIQCAESPRPALHLSELQLKGGNLARTGSVFVKVGQP